MTEQNKRLKIHSGKHNKEYNVFTNYNGFLNHPCIVNISIIRIPAIYELYKYISLWDESKLNDIPNTLIYLRLKKDSEYKENILLKSSMIEEQVHKHALSLNKYYLYLKCYNKGLHSPFIHDFKDSPDNYSRLQLYIDSIPNVDHRKLHLEMLYTRMSFFEYNLFTFVRTSYMLVKFTDQQRINMQRLLDNEFQKYKHGNTIIHNEEYLNKAPKCAICIDAYADCMYSNCRHLCICYNCLLKLNENNRICCIICRQHNDCIIQTLNP